MNPIERFAGSAAEWDGFVRSCAGWTHYHLYGWKAVLERRFTHECIYLAARGESGALAGILPLVRVRSALFGHYLVSLPFLNYGGPLGSSAATTALAEYAAELADATRADLMELRCRSEIPTGLTVSHRKITVLLDLPSDGDADRLWRGLDAKVRSQVRRPQKEGVRVEFGAEQVGPFFDVFSRHMRDLGTPTHSARLFEAMLQEFPESMWVGVAYLDEQPIATGCGFHWDGEFEMTWAASLREHNRIAPNMLLYWRFIERCIAEGITTFNFGRCTPGGGTHRFKRQWGGRDQPLWWYQRIRGRAATPSPTDARFSWGPRLWQRLPLPVAEFLGPRIVRYIP
jgi:FemAB-related protein (PEP-CTERM system-associated)